jgi:hypothetical protein
MRHGYLAFDEPTQTAASAPQVRVVPDPRPKPGDST